MRAVQMDRRCSLRYIPLTGRLAVVTGIGILCLSTMVIWSSGRRYDLSPEQEKLLLSMRPYIENQIAEYLKKFSKQGVDVQINRRRKKTDDSKDMPSLSSLPKFMKKDTASTVKRNSGGFSKDEMTGPIDLDEDVPSTDLLYERLTLVTAASEHHHREMLGFIGSAQRVMPDRPIVVYDLGLENDTREMIQSLCNVKVRSFPFERYPNHVRTLGKFGWKAAVVTEALNDIGIIYYGDSSVRFHRPVKDLISNGLEHHGFVPHIRCFNPKLTVNDPWGCKHDYQVTAKEVYPILGVDEEEYYNANFSAPAVSATLMFVINNTFIQTNILKPWLECSLNEDCIAPRKSSRKNHRFDQSALTLLFFKNMRGEWTVENNPTPYHLAFMSIQRGSDGYLWHPQTCRRNADG